MSALLAAAGLVKRFGGVLATNDVDFAVEPGEIRGLIGPNGAGKTTLVNLLTGIYAPDAGAIRFDGVAIGGLEPHRIARRGLIRTFQVTRLFPSLSLTDNLMLPYLARSGHGHDGPARARHFLELTGLTRLADEPARSLSGGQRALLQVAAGFMHPSLKCYVLDEPFAGINPVIKDTIIELIEQENRERGVAFIVVSHEMAVIRRLCPVVTVMIDGRVAAEGPLATVAADETVLTAYLGAAPV
ncbi:MAG TPA: ABC transporter ATP-binding protein [Stellaceae bacterium]|jgi:branched-chain amino acid transport system ATP-binding protein|nr:ABC transporter ATP-binding protein [Stellaceae bacterium]